MKKTYYIAVMLFAFVTGFSQKQMPNITIKSENNKSFNVKTDFKEKDKLYVFAFWATWCAPCLNELDAINEKYALWSKELNIEVIAVSIDDTRTQKRVKPLLNGKKLVLN